jgi:hypothetical protein
MINSLEDLGKLFELCRAHKVTEIAIADIKASFAYEPEVVSAVMDGEGDSGMPQELKGDDLIFYSASRPPELEG